MLKNLISGLSTKRLLVRAIPLLLAATLPVSLYSQAAGTASVQGTVTDQTGAAVPSATVTLTQTATGVARVSTTDRAGVYAMPNVPVGPYSLSVTAQGFSTFTQTGVLEVGNSISIDPQMKVGSASEHVEVQASGVSLETETSTFK